MTEESKKEKIVVGIIGCPGVGSLAHIVAARMEADERIKPVIIALPEDRVEKDPMDLISGVYDEILKRKKIELKEVMITNSYNGPDTYNNRRGKRLRDKKKKKR